MFCDVLCTVCVYMCTVLLPPGVYIIAVKYIISYRVSEERLTSQGLCFLELAIVGNFVALQNLHTPSNTENCHLFINYRTINKTFLNKK